MITGVAVTELISDNYTMRKCIDKSETIADEILATIVAYKKKHAQ